MDDGFRAYCLGADEEAVAFWTTWRKKNPGKQQEINKAKEMYHLLNGGHTAESFQRDKAVFLRRLKKQGIHAVGNSPALVAATADAKKSPRIRLSLWIGVAAAVVVTLVFTAIALRDHEEKKNTVAHSVPAADRPPGGDKAVLTLANGRTIVLDSTANGVFAQEDKTKISKLGGALSYQSEGPSTAVFYNTVTTPVGGQYRIVLADGTKVWLNALSSLRFPTAFTGTNRGVALTGEGYFEVSHNANKPFRVQVNEVEITVLGTQFNVNAYADEKALQTTLLQGKVEIKDGDKKAMLLPGQGATVPKEPAGKATIQVQNDVDVEAVTGWKNGLFNFEHADIKTILRQLARWYDVEVHYEGAIKGDDFFGIVNRSSSLASVLKALKAGGPANLSYRIEGRKLIVQAPE